MILHHLYNDFPHQKHQEHYHHHCDPFQEHPHHHHHHPDHHHHLCLCVWVRHLGSWRWLTGAAQPNNTIYIEQHYNIGMKPTTLSIMYFVMNCNAIQSNTSLCAGSICLMHILVHILNQMCLFNKHLNSVQLFEHCSLFSVTRRSRSDVSQSVSQSVMTRITINTTMLMIMNMVTINMMRWPRWWW